MWCTASLQKKRETEPDPVEEAPPARREEPQQRRSGAAAGMPPRWQCARGAEHLDHRHWRPPSPTTSGAVAQVVVSAAAFLRKRDPFSPASLPDAARNAMGRIARALPIP